MTFNKTLKATAAISAAVLIFTGCSLTEPDPEMISAKEQGISQMTEGNYAGAIDSFNTALSHRGLFVTPDAVDTNYYKAAAQYLSGDNEGAMATYTHLIEYAPTNTEASFLRGTLYLDMQDAESALSDYRTSIDLSPEDYDRYIEIYENLKAAGMPDQAMDFLNLALEQNGSSSDDYVGRGRIYILLNQYQAAEKVLNNAVEEGSAVAKIYLAQVYDATGEPDKANELLEEYASSAEVSSETLYVLGNIRMESGDYAGALNAYDQALALPVITNEKDIMKNRITALEYTAQWEAAYSAATELLEKYPNEQDVIREATFLKSRTEGPY